MTPNASPAGEAEDRKARSIELLKSEGVPVIEHLPFIETVNESHRRSQEEVVQRALALMIVGVKGETGDDELIGKLIEQFGVRGYFSAEEQAFLENEQASEHDRIQFAWRYEAAFVMLWALGVFPELSRPDAIADVPAMAAFLREAGAEGLRAKARLRDQEEIVEAADLIYRYHWAVRQAWLDGAEPPAGLDAGVAMERHWALNWLIMDVGWDDVSTDT